MTFKNIDVLGPDPWFCWQFYPLVYTLFNAPLALSALYASKSVRGHQATHCEIPFSCIHESATYSRQKPVGEKGVLALLTVIRWRVPIREISVSSQYYSLYLFSFSHWWICISVFSSGRSLRGTIRKGSDPLPCSVLTTFIDTKIQQHLRLLSSHSP